LSDNLALCRAGLTVLGASIVSTFEPEEGVIFTFFLGRNASMSASSSLLSSTLPESELVTACSPAFITLLLELCELRGTLERVDIDEKEVVVI